MHALAIGYSPAYLSENADGIRRDWPRIPLPAIRKTLEASAALGEQIAALLDTEADVPGVTCGKIAPAIQDRSACMQDSAAADLTRTGGDLAITAGWGHFGKEGVVMPAKGKLVERAYDEDEAEAIDAEAAVRGCRPRMSGGCWAGGPRRVPQRRRPTGATFPLNVWEYYIGGYQVIKKWLSYREHEILGRPLSRKRPAK